MTHKILVNLACSALALSALGLATHADQTAKPLTIKLKLEATGAPKQLGYYPVHIVLSDVKPAQVVKETVYRGKPQYGIIHLGNGPKADTVIAVDAPETGDYKIYVDVNNNGDLTDDGNGAWSTKREGAQAMYGLNHYVLHTSYGTSKHETKSANYGVALYQFVGKDRLFMYREAGAVGTVTLGGKTHKVVVVENDADGLFAKPIDDNGKPVDKSGKPLQDAKASRPVWLLIDQKDDGKFTDADGKQKMYNASAPFTLEGTTYEPIFTPDGSKLTLKPTTRVAYAPKAPERPKLLAAGTMAPNFQAIASDGHTVQLADYKGKTVILDFWATWCGPCQVSMPHVQKIYQAVKDKDVVVLGICVWDGREEYDKWIPAHKEQYTFEFAFDPAAKDTAKSIASLLYKVSGIPTTYIIDKEGKIVDSVVGYSPGNTELEAALKKINIEVPTITAAK